MAAKRRKSIIPLKAQIPVMVIGAIALVIILVWRINGIRKLRQGESVATEQTLVEQTDALQTAELDTLGVQTVGDDTEGLLEDIEAVAGMLNELRQDITAYRTGARLTRRRSYISLARDPFRSAIPQIAQNGVTSGDNENRTPQISLNFNKQKERQARLDALRIQGTLIAESYASAVLNGQVIVAGDTVSGFVIDSVGHREIVLSDDMGAVTLHMEGVPKF